MNHEPVNMHCLFVLIGLMMQVPHLHAEDLATRTKLKRTVPGQSLMKFTGRPVKQEPDHELDGLQDVVVGESEVEQGPTLGIVAFSAKQRSRRKAKSSPVSVKAATSHCPHAMVAEEKCSNKVNLLLYLDIRHAECIFCIRLLICTYTTILCK